MRICVRFLVSFATGLLFLGTNLFGQFRPNLPQFDNGVTLGSFVEADVNHDGKTDIVGIRSPLAPQPNFQVVVLLGNGTGGFGAPVVTSITGVKPIAFITAQPFVIGDFNDDGHLDLAVFGTDPVTAQLAVAVLLGNGDGTFQAGKESIVAAAAGQPSAQTCAYIAGDYNGDGKLDLAYSSSSGIVVLPGKGDGTFSTAVVTAQTGGCLATGDFNNDKKLDLAVATPPLNSPASVSLLLGNGNGTFQAPTAVGAASGPIAAADVNGDGDLDLVTSSGSVFLGNGTGHFPTTHTFTKGGTGTFAVIDVNGDGHPDIVEHATNFTVNVYLNNGSGVFTAGKTYIDDGSSNPGLVAADLNGDKKIDLAFPNFSAGISALTGNGNGTFNANIATAGFVLAPKAAVFVPGQKTGILDSNQTTKFMVGNGDGTFTVKTTTCTVRSAAIGDFNHDGKIDYAGMNAVSGVPYVEVCLNNGNGTFTSTGQQFDVGVAHGLLLAGDFNGDGKLDLFATDANGFSILLGNGDGTFQNGIPTAFPGVSPIYALGDFNHDGKVDVAIINGASGEQVSSVFLGKGDGTFLPPVTSPAAGGKYVAAADLNGDGKLDLVIDGDANVIVMLGKGDGTFQTPVRYAVNATTRPAIADFNLDGHLDIAVANGSTRQVSVLFNDGTGKFPTQAQFRIPGITNDGLAVADFNGDKKPDLVINVYPGNGVVTTVETMLHQ